MAQAIYKVVKEFEHDGVMRKLGEELALGAREGDTLIKQHLVTEGRFLDPADPKDAKLIEEVKSRRGEKHDEMTAREEERDAEKEVNLEKKDEDEAKEKAEKEEKENAEKEGGEVTDESQADLEAGLDEQPEGGDDTVDESEVTTEDAVPTEEAKPVTKRKGLLG